MDSLPKPDETWISDHGNEAEIVGVSNGSVQFKLFGRPAILSVDTFISRYRRKPAQFVLDLNK